MIHPKIKEILGFDPQKSDDENLHVWIEQTSEFQKPCWKLNYCPYGILVEKFPLLPAFKESALKHHEYLKVCLEKGLTDNDQPLDENRRKLFKKMVSEFNLEDYPDEIPEEILIWECLIFGHICPVVFVAEFEAETPPPT